VVFYLYSSQENDNGKNNKGHDCYNTLDKVMVLVLYTSSYCGSPLFEITSILFQVMLRTRKSVGTLLITKRKLEILNSIKTSQNG
jgi:hypothetical protein